jgi:hypothetical protein
VAALVFISSIVENKKLLHLTKNWLNHIELQSVTKGNDAIELAIQLNND